MWATNGDPVPLFQSLGSPGQRLCISDEAREANIIQYMNVGKDKGVAVFLTAAPRTRASIFSPIAQGVDSVGFGGINYTDNAPGAGWEQSSADPGTQSIPVRNSKGETVMEIMPTLQQPRGNSFAFRGVEAAAVASTTCFTENHRGAAAEGGPVRPPPPPTPVCNRDAYPLCLQIRMPGLFPRTMDLMMGWGKVDSCVDARGSDVIQALADQPLFDLTGRGGGSSPQFASITGPIYSWAAGVGYALNPSGEENSELWIHADTNYGGEVMADTGGLVCATQDANRCVGPCNLVKTIVTGVVGGPSCDDGINPWWNLIIPLTRPPPGHRPRASAGRCPKPR